MDGSGRKLRDEDLEEDMFQWIMQKRPNNFRVTQVDIKRKAVALAYEKSHINFSGSDGWCDRFIKRCDLSSRARFNDAQRLPKDLVPKIGSFFTFLRN